MSEDDFEEREKKLRESLRDQARRISVLRSKDRAFHGLEREFRYFQEQMLTDFERSGEVKHPRDVGSAREAILRRFLVTSGYLPKKYGVSDRSARVVSTTGHMSGEIDIALYDEESTLTLMQREDVYVVYPIECIYGVIQVKSRLTKSELQSGFKNLASFKRLERKARSPSFQIVSGRRPSPRGFAILFAYSTDMRWMDLVREIKALAALESPRNLPNAIVILDRGIFLFGDEERDGLSGHYTNEKFEVVEKVSLNGIPDREGLCLFQMYTILLDLLRHTTVQPPSPESYFRLPLLADDQSYTFSFGQFAELGRCEEHGDFARTIPTDKLNVVVDWCKTAEPINWIKATDIAYGRPDNPTAYERQPGDVRIYNPDQLPLKDILIMEYKVGDRTVHPMAFDTIEAAGFTIFIPYYYSAKEDLITGCLKCRKKNSMIDPD